MEPDPMAEYEKRGITWAKAMAHVRRLAAEASQRAREDPAAKLVAVVMTPDTSEMRDIVAELRRQGREPRDWVAVLMPRDEALRILRGNAPATLDWIEPHSSGATRRLPVVVGTPFGYKFGAEAYEVATFE